MEYEKENIENTKDIYCNTTTSYLFSWLLINVSLFGKVI